MAQATNSQQLQTTQSVDSPTEDQNMENFDFEDAELSNQEHKEGMDVDMFAHAVLQHVVGGSDLDSISDYLFSELQTIKTIKNKIDENKEVDLTEQVKFDNYVRWSIDRVSNQRYYLLFIYLFIYLFVCFFIIIYLFIYLFVFFLLLLFVYLYAFFLLLLLFIYMHFLFFVLVSKIQ